MLIASFTNAINANIAKDLLQNAGISAHSSADALTQLYPGTFAIHLAVDPVDAAEATQFYKKRLSRRIANLTNPAKRQNSRPVFSMAVLLSWVSCDNR